jgi:predicted acylesterase/phospholipase RssA
MANANLPVVQRAIVLQGGGALGAYDAGMLKALCEKIHDIDSGRNKKKINVFDILAGTSSGAINAAIVSGLVTKSIKAAKRDGKEPDFEKVWDEALEGLHRFWRQLSVESDAERDPFFNQRWKTYKKFNECAASPEAARRWYSTRQFLQYGAKNVFKAPASIRDEKYFDSFNTWYQYDNSPLRESIKKCNCFPLDSKHAEGHPRLLMVSVDVMDGVPVTFDSYEKAPGFRFSQYGKSGSKHTIQYDNGITEYHVMASASVPVNYDYAQLQDSVNNNSPRYFWDGGWLSNTPLRELINEHQAFWTKEIQDSALESDMWKEDKGVRKVPDLRVYITNVWPKEVGSIPGDHDRIVERSRDMFFMDKTEYDEKVATLVDDYINLVKELRKLGYDNAANKGSFNEALRQLMNRNASSLETSQKQRQNMALIKGRFDVRVHRIQLSDDEDSTSRKFFDYSRATIENLMEQGYHDGQNQFRDIISQQQ